MGVLHGNVAEATDAGDGDPLPGPGVGHLEAFVDGDACAENRCDLKRIGTVRDPRRVGGIDEHVAAEAPVDAVAAVLLALAQCFPTGAAVFACSARRPQPRVADLVADLQVVDAVAECDHGAVALVAGNERRLWLGGPISVCRMQIRMADAGGFEFDKRLTVAGRRQFQLFDL